MESLCLSIRQIAPEEYYYMFNAQGDVVALVDGTGKVVVEYSYDAWGNRLPSPEV